MGSLDIDTISIISKRLHTTFTHLRQAKIIGIPGFPEEKTLFPAFPEGNFNSRISRIIFRE